MNTKKIAQKITRHRTRGITLIETVVAVTILVAAITGPMTLASQSLKASRDARNELIATHLAEEGVEIVHSVRDNNSATDISATRTSWMNTIYAACMKGCGADPTDHTVPVWGPNVVISCPAGDCSSVQNLYFNPATGLYKQSANPLSSPWSITPFKRVITLQGIDAGPQRQVRVTSTVTYSGFANTLRTVTVVDDLYNWFPRLN